MKTEKKTNHDIIKMTNNQSKCFQKLGVGTEDVKLAERLLNQIPPCPSDPNNKVEQLMGYARMRLLREKALRVLGTSETEVELENAKNLGSLGVGGRRRSWCGGQKAVLDNGIGIGWLRIKHR